MRSGALLAMVLASAVVSAACGSARPAGVGLADTHASNTAAQGSGTGRQGLSKGSTHSAQAGRRPGAVLVNQPARRVCLGKKFTVGVWFQQSGGSRAYRLSVYSPRHRRIFFRRGQAPSSHWAFWKIHATRAGAYHTVYSAHWRSATAWTRYRVATEAHRC